MATTTGVGHDHRPRPSGDASFKPPRPRFRWWTTRSMLGFGAIRHERLRRCQAGDRLPYIPPSGWIEQLKPVPESRSQVQRFHLRANCPAIHPDTIIVTSDKPYSAALCPACAK